RLSRVLPEHVLERPVDDVRGRVRPGGRLTPNGVHLGVDVVPLPHLAGLDHAAVHDDLAGSPLRVDDAHQTARRAEVAVVADLPSGLRVERSAVEDEADLLALS